jgi:hypothetical protein
MLNVTRDQASVLAENFHPKAGYLGRLRDQMEKTGRKDDPIYPLLVSAHDVSAHDAVHRLWVYLHYEGFGVERPPE